MADLYQNAIGLTWLGLSVAAGNGAVLVSEGSPEMRVVIPLFRQLSFEGTWVFGPVSTLLV